MATYVQTVSEEGTMQWLHVTQTTTPNAQHGAHEGNTRTMSRRVPRQSTPSNIHHDNSSARKTSLNNNTKMHGVSQVTNEEESPC